MEHTKEIEEDFKNIKTIQFICSFDVNTNPTKILLMFDDNYSGNGFSLLQNEYGNGKAILFLDVSKMELSIRTNKQEDTITISNFKYIDLQLSYFQMAMHHKYPLFLCTLRHGEVMKFAECVIINAN
jgi:hypothetical protein